MGHLLTASKLFVFLALCPLIYGCDPASVREAKSEIAAAMRDPGSAEFRSVKMFNLDGRDAVCGEVNGKNAFGALAGYSYFLYIDPLMRIGSTTDSSMAIYSCCDTLQKSGTVGEAKFTNEIEGCAAMEPMAVYSSK